MKEIQGGIQFFGNVFFQDIDLDLVFGAEVSIYIYFD